MLCQPFEDIFFTAALLLIGAFYLPTVSPKGTAWKYIVKDDFFNQLSEQHPSSTHM